MKKINNQKGNVLFLILIAVALFAALSYAVTQSSRSGGDASRETNILNAAQLTQYPTSIRTAVLRLVIDGYQDTNILYNPPTGAGFTAASEPYEVFATIGGGAINQNAPAEVMQIGGVNETGVWYINMDYEVPNLGRTSVAGVSGNELIAFLPGITESVCTRINLEANIITNPTTPNPIIGNAMVGTAGAGAEKNISLLEHYTTDIPAGALGILDTATTTPFGDLAGQPFGCFQDNGGGTQPYVLYTVILER